MEILSICDVLMQVIHELAKERVLHRMWKDNEHNNRENSKLTELIYNKESVLKVEDNAKREAREAHKRDIARLMEKNSKETRDNM